MGGDLRRAAWIEPRVRRSERYYLSMRKNFGASFGAKIDDRNEAAKSIASPVTTGESTNAAHYAPFRPKVLNPPQIWAR
jgi:hypothetical protein